MYDKLLKLRQSFRITLYFFENPDLYGKMWENIVERGTPQMSIWHIRIAYFVTNATNFHSEYVILIAFTLQKWLREHSSMLTLYAHCLYHYFSSNFLPIWQNFKAAFIIANVILNILVLSFSFIYHNNALRNKIPGNVKFLNF